MWLSKLPLCLILVSVTMAGTQQHGLTGSYKRHENHQNDAHVQKLASFATEKISGKEGKKLELVKLVSVSTQVVAGKNYKFILDLATPEQKVQAFEAVIYEPLGAESPQLTEHKAIDKANAELASEQSSESRSGALLGGYKEQDADSAEVQEAAKFATEQISQQSNSLVPPQLKKVLQAKQKVANGKVWDLKLEVSSGNQPAKVYEVQVAQSLQNDFKLEKIQAV